MAQLQGEPAADLEIVDTSSDPTLSFSNTWHFSDSDLNRLYSNCVVGTERQSSDKCNVFNFLNEKRIELSWFLSMYPCGKSGIWNEHSKENKFLISVDIDELPRCQNIEIDSIKVRVKVKIAKLYVGQAYNNVVYRPGSMAYTIINADCGLTKELFEKHGILGKNNNGTNDGGGTGFDISATVAIQSITFKHIKNKNVSNTNDNGNNGNGISGGEMNDTILRKLENIENEMNKMKMEIRNLKNNGNKNDNNNNGNNVDIGKKEQKKLELEKFILDIFNGDMTLGQEYINLFVVKEGFDEISTFCKLTENDLKEMAIDKRGHRIKILSKIAHYNSNLFANDNIVINAPNAAFDVEGNEFKE